MYDTISPFLHDHASSPAPLAYAVELDGVAIGVAMPVRGGYVFRTAEQAFLALDGRRFRRVSQVSRAAGALRRKAKTGTG